MYPFSLLGRHLPVLLLFVSSIAGAQDRPTTAAPLTLMQAFEAAWARQPEARSEPARRDAAGAQLDAAGSWSAAPPTAEVRGKSDQFNGNQGAREYEAGIAVPLWLSGERSRSQALAGAELSAVSSRSLGSRWRLAALVREAYWAWLKAAIERDTARVRQANAEELAADVGRRVRAGDLSRADQHQADGAAASAAVAVAEAEAGLAQAAQQLRSLVGYPLPLQGVETPEPFPNAEQESAAQAQGHPLLRQLADQVDVARRGNDLARVQSRAHPELIVAATRERSPSEIDFSNTLTVGMRLPFGSDSRHRARLAKAMADQDEAEAQLAIDQERIQSEIATARVRVTATRSQVAAAERRAQLARETRGFFEKSFRLGESDLPTRLRIELEAFEAERQAARARIDAAQAISSLRQALGLLPE